MNLPKRELLSFRRVLQTQPPASRHFPIRLDTGVVEHRTK